ncbi:30S ribosomal protein S16 [Bacteroidota bacterium]
MVKLRLRRKGRKHFAVYDVIAVDGRKKRDGAYLERLGFYDPNMRPSKISIDPDRALYWLNVGAQPTPIVQNLLSYEGILLRRALAFKGKNQVEIEEAVKEHKEKVLERYFQKKEARKKKKEDKIKAETDAKQAEAEASEAPAPKEEAPAPKEEVPKEEAPKEEAPKEEAQKEEAPKEEAPKEEAPTEEAPKEEAPKEETPKEEPANG